MPVLLVLAGCAKVPSSSSGTLTSYANLKTNNSLLTNASLFVDEEALARFRTVRIVGTTHTAAAASAVANSQDRRLVENAVDRALCVGLSDRFVVVHGSRQADLTVRSTITQVVATNATIAGVSTVATLGAAALAVPATRLPFGLGGLAVEAEALDASGVQVAAMLWGRGANSFTERARVSSVGDAYSLAFKFGGDFARMLKQGTSPFGGMPGVPSAQRIRSNLGGAPRYEACETFGRAPGVGGFVGGQIGLSPRLTDGGTRQ